MNPYPERSYPEAAAGVLVLDPVPAHHALVRGVVTAQGFELVTAADVGDALRAVRVRHLELAVVAVGPDVQQAVGLLLAFKETDPALDVIVIAPFERPEDHLWLLRHALAFDVLRPLPADTTALMLALDVAVRRRARLAEAILARRAAPPATPRAAAPDRHPLTPKEVETLRLVSEGLENREIARRMVISENTVRNNLARIYSKLGAENRTQAVNIARRAAAF